MAEPVVENAAAAATGTGLDGAVDVAAPQGGEGAAGAPGGAGGPSQIGRRVYVGNLAWRVQWQDLKDHMKSAGTVLHADVFTNSNGSSRGCGLVEYDTVEEAQHAIATLSDTVLFDRRIFVREDREEHGGGRRRGRRRDFDNGGNYGAGGEYGGGNREGGDGGGGYEYAAAGNDYSGGGNDYNGGGQFEGRRGGRGGRGGYRGGGARSPNYPAARPAAAAPAYEVSEPNECLVFVGNLPWKVTSQELGEIFSRLGEVEEAEVYSYDGRSRGCGTVLFKTPELARQAVAEFHDMDLDGRPLLVRLDQGKRRRQQQQ